MRSFLFTSFVCLMAATQVAAQFGMQQPQPRSTGEQQFKPTNGGQGADDYCGGQAMAKAQSTLFTGSPAAYVNTIINNNPNGAGARIVIQLVQYFQNGTRPTSNPNVTVPIYYHSTPYVLVNETADLKQGQQQKYNRQLTIPDQFAGCGATATENPVFTQTRCVLRWVYDNSPSNGNSRVSCADVIIARRQDDIPFEVRVALAEGDVPIQQQTALNRVLNNPWATDTTREIDIFTLADDEDGSKMSNQIRLADPGIVVAGDRQTYVIKFVLSSTTTMSSQQMADSLTAENLSLMFDLTVLEAATADLSAAGTASTSVVATILAAFAAWMMQRA